MLLLEAPNARAALRSAKQRGRQAQYRYQNDAGGVVRFEFVGVLDLLRLGVECEPDEVWYRICEMVEPTERRASIIPPEAHLRAVAEERERRRADSFDNEVKRLGKSKKFQRFLKERSKAAATTSLEDYRRSLG